MLTAATAVCHGTGGDVRILRFGDTTQITKEIIRQAPRNHARPASSPAATASDPRRAHNREGSGDREGSGAAQRGGSYVIMATARRAQVPPPGAGAVGAAAGDRRA